MEAVRYTSGVRAGIDWYAEGANQTFRRGAVVTLDPATGLVVEFTGNEDVLGVASMNANGVMGAKVGIWLATGDVIFSGSVAAGSTVLTDLTRQYGIVKLNNLWLIDKDEVVNTRICVVNVDSRDDLGSVNGRFLFIFLPDTRQLRF